VGAQYTRLEPFSTEGWFKHSACNSPHSMLLLRGLLVPILLFTGSPDVPENRFYLNNDMVEALRLLHMTPTAHESCTFTGFRTHGHAQETLGHLAGGCKAHGTKRALKPTGVMQQCICFVVTIPVLTSVLRHRAVQDVGTGSHLRRKPPQAAGSCALVACCTPVSQVDQCPKTGSEASTIAMPYLPLVEVVCHAHAGMCRNPIAGKCLNPKPLSRECRTCHWYRSCVMPMLAYASTSSAGR
jgi:hypothetical protein